MANDLYIGRSPEGNDLYIESIPASTFTITADVVVDFVPGFNFDVDIPVVASFVGEALRESVFSIPISVDFIGVGQSSQTVFTIDIPVTFSVDNSLVLYNIDVGVDCSFIGEPRSEFAPYLLWPGYVSDDITITIPIADFLPDLKVSEANAVTGDWRAILEAFVQNAHDYYRSWGAHQVTPGNRQPRTYYSHLLTDWNAKNPRLNQGIKRRFTVAMYSRIQSCGISGEP
jgi:hypothetical protein